MAKKDPNIVDAPAKGHNTNAMIKSVIERVERLEEEKRDLSADISEIYKEAKGNGLNPKTLRAAVRRRRMSTEERDTYDSELELYEGVFA